MVEQTQEEKTQAEALSVVLSLQYFSVFHARAMDEESGFALLKRILLSPECKIGYHTLKVSSLINDSLPLSFTVMPDLVFWVVRSRCIEHFASIGISHSSTYVQLLKKIWVVNSPSATQSFSV